MITSNLEIVAQTTSTLILPKEISGSVQLDITPIIKQNIKQSTYECLSVFVKNAADEYNSNAVQGRYTVENEYLIFKPYFPFEKGMTYIVRTKETNGNYAFQSFQVGKKEAVEEAKVLSIYPSADELPENLLRFYFYFNTPMKKEEAVKHIQLIDAEGNIDDKAFMEFKQELWSADGKRLTLLFDPGRIKRGVSTNLELGPALLEGNKYQLTVSGSWQDVHGQELSIKTTKEFVVVEAYRHQINVDELKIQKPKPNSNDALSIQFDRIMDHALIQSMLRIKDENKKPIAGHWEISEDEKIVQFIPEKPWKKGTYRIVMDSRMEDVAANNLNNLLDQKTGKKNSNHQQKIRRFTI
jgi:hypothetical protein